MITLQTGAQAIIAIGGNVYGGGNEGKVHGNTTVTVHAGDLNNVFGGARKADVGGHTFVNIDGEHASDYILINRVYGGNDISGTIGASAVLPTALTATGANGVDAEWNAFLRVSSINHTDPENPVQNKVYLGQLFGGGNGAYDYTSKTLEGGEANPCYGLDKPVLARTYLEIVGGSMVYVFGGGNNATVTDSTVIYVDNMSDVVNSITDAEGNELLTSERTNAMGFNPGYTYPTSDAFQIGSFFGGNNLAKMAIRPKWNLQRGKIRNLYSGGNRGDMTSQVGLLLEIDPQAENAEHLIIDNVYGGCRMADVHPLTESGLEVAPEKVQLPDPYKFPAGLSARVLVRGGNVNNVYGGNDISGRVYGGNAVGVYTDIRGDVYGGGNGSYPYTDNADLKGDPTYGDLYYDGSAAASSVDALNAIRPNAEQVSIRLYGTKTKPTVIGGSVYVGGNCATLATTKAKPMVELKIGSYVYADHVFLGNNGENMVQTYEREENNEARYHDGVLRTYRKQLNEIDSQRYGGNTTKFSTMDLTQEGTFAKYMEGVAMDLMPRVVFDAKENGDPDDYKEYSSFFGSVFCGGNIGSMTSAGKTVIDFNHQIIIFNKLVGGCNNANVAKVEGFNAAYEGGLIGEPDNSNNKLELNLSGLKIQPKRWVDETDKTQGLEWNTIKASTGERTAPVTSGASPDSPVESTDEDHDRRLTGGNIYGGCYTSGHVNGNVVVNLNATIFDRDVVFDEVELNTESGEPKLYGNDQYKITKRNSGVILDQQGMDVLGASLNVFGGGYGKDSEIWGSTTINLNRGYTFQIFGGGEQGVIGKPDSEGDYVFNGKKYKYNPDYSCTINVNGSIPGVHRGHDDDTPDMADVEFVYGGAFIGPVCGNTTVNLGNGRVFNTFAGSCNADILGHTETYIGRDGFPYVRDYVYGGNDLGGKIKGTANFASRVRTTENGGYDAIGKVSNPDMLNASAYVEYMQGRVEKIYGGCYGVYDYTDSHYGAYFYATDGEGTTDANRGKARTGYSKPWMDNAFVNFRPTDSNNTLNTVEQIFGAGQGYLGEPEENDLQQRSYILVDIPQSMSAFQSTEFFGAGECGGVGMSVSRDVAKTAETAHKASAIIDLARGNIKAVYGGSYEEGITRRTVVNVPEGSTIKLDKIFGGAYGISNEYPCDVYEANVNWNSREALVGNYRIGIYGGNNAFRRTLYSKVNINAPVWYDKENDYYATVYGAGYGKDTWAQYTEVNLNNTAQVYEVYGGGQLGRVLNKNTVAKLKEDLDKDNAEGEKSHLPIDLGNGYTDDGLNDDKHDNVATYEYNTNVRINEGAWVSGYLYNGARSGGYAYGGGLGDAKTPNTGDVHGTTYIGLFGGKVEKDIYAAGTVGSVNNRYKVDKDDFDNNFIAGTNAIIEGGTARNVYGGGWQGSVGYHEGGISASTVNDVLGETNVTIGKTDGTSLINGIPAIERNAYGGGEGGAVFGTTHITLNKGFIGYRYFAEEPEDKTRTYIQQGTGYYQEKLDDETWNGDGTNRLYDSGCIFGGGYIDNSNVDVSHVKMYGGHVRNSLFGGGEIAAIGRGVINATGEFNSVRSLQGIYKAGRTNLEMFDGHVHRNVFGGGRGYNNLGESGTLYSDGYVFGQTEVHIHGGEIGNETVSSDEERKNNGNVFGGGDIGYVYSAYEEDGKLYVGIKAGKRYDDKRDGYYYIYDKGNEAYIPTDFSYDEDDSNWVKEDNEFVLSEDCKVLVEPHTRVKVATTINGHNYKVGDYVSTTDLNTLGTKSDPQWANLEDAGIIIHNAVFAGGNTSSGSATVFANATTVFGNATASIHDVYNRDLITLGSSHIGGLYGDGNLTFVDGYRGLNITNYGTDFYSIAPEVSLEAYNNLPAREAAYYELRYKCEKECTDKEGKTYTVGSTISQDELITLFNGIMIDEDTPMVDASGHPNTLYWKENGVRSRYAGRPMNTIQRADFCGVWGSRMVMQGAQDRVPEIVDYTNYTINRVREVSLNKKLFDKTQPNGDYHGNYFGIYNVVNYLGALTSDFDFGDDNGTGEHKDVGTGTIRTSDNNDKITYGPEYEGQTFFGWKKKHIHDRIRNNGNSHNQVALASGVYLELTTENSKGTGLNEKDWGYITGVVELDLINVQAGMGGGFVYAKNVHGKRSRTNLTHTTITDLNQGAISKKMFSYSDTDADKVEWQTSGNFVHSTQTIIDDCYNISGRYLKDDGVPAHYWYIKGSVYVYDQYISAFTGAPNAYSEQVDIPLTITAASHGTMKLLNVMPNRYAYYAVNNGTSQVKLEGDRKIVINDVSYGLNTPISYWDWYLLSASEKNLFVEDTYYVKEDCKVGNTEYKAGTVMLSSEYKELRGTGATPPTVIQKKEVGGIEGSARFCVGRR